MAERMMGCQKRLYLSQADAELGLQALIEEAKRSGRGGTSWKRLNIYFCFACRGYHLGRANQLPKNYKPAPVKTIPSTGELRRRLRHLEKTWQRHEDRHRRHQVAMLAKIIEEDLAAIQFEEDLRQVRDI